MSSDHPSQDEALREMAEARAKAAEALRKRAVALAKEGLTLSVIAERLRKSDSFVKAACDAAGVELKKRDPDFFRERRGQVRSNPSKRAR